MTKSPNTSKKSIKNQSPKAVAKPAKVPKDENRLSYP